MIVLLYVLKFYFRLWFSDLSKSMNRSGFGLGADSSPENSARSSPGRFDSKLSFNLFQVEINIIN